MGAILGRFCSKVGLGLPDFLLSFSSIVLPSCEQPQREHLKHILHLGRLHVHVSLSIVILTLIVGLFQIGRRQNDFQPVKEILL